jgi:sigma-B regulation protein RsbU (phosphoserine phosphatase)
LEPSSEIDSEIPSILIVDDDQAICRLLATALRGDGEREIEIAATAAEARTRLRSRRFDVVVTDIAMPHEDGISLMQWASEHTPGASWIVLTGYATVDAAVRALQLGAFDFFTKPLESLAAFTNTVSHALEHRRLVAEHRRLHAELEQRNTELQANVNQLEAACHLLSEQADSVALDLRRAALIQQALLPRAAPRLQGMSVNALYRPSQDVGGDLYDVVRLDERHLVLIIADAAGHGLSAAMLAVLFRNRLSLVDQDTHEPCRPSDVLRSANRSMAESITVPGFFITAAYCLLDLAKRRIQIASAGHPPLLLRRASGSLERLTHTGPALGLHSEAIYTEHEVAMQDGDLLLLHTDGLDERVGSPESHGEDLASAVQETPEAGVELLRRLFEGPGDGPGLPQEDDVTLLALAADAGPSVFDNGAPVSAPPPAARTGAAAELLFGELADRITLCVRGRGNWKHSATFHEKCVEAIESRRPVMVDLTLCEHLDSTFLGTIHELCERSDQADIEFRIQGVTPCVERLFVELGMRAVMDHIVPPVLPLPRQLAPLVGSELDKRSQALHLLRVHQGLAGLNERNLREFDPLLEMLRHEVAALEQRTPR